MQITTKGCYGLRAMIELGRRFGEGPVLMQTIAESQGISRKYLHALLTTLRMAGLVRSVRGAGGGYMLAKAPKQIGLIEIIHALEGPFRLSDCVQNPSRCVRSETCPGHRVWQLVSRSLTQLLSEFTLDHLMTDTSESDNMP